MNKKDIPKAYDAKQVEDQIYSAWEQSGLFNPDNLEGEPFSIMMPPPNVTGILHLGHALENSMMDTMIRYQRLKGKKALLLPGTDHAAIATQSKVEKILMDKGVENPRQELGREKLVEEIRQFAEDSKSTILSQIKKLGTSCDWSRLAYTFDEDRNRAVKELFVRMYNDGLIYRGYRVVNWSVKGQSTSSDDEIVHVERAAKFYTFKYSKDFPITIATTRPETKLGDTAVAVHPNDKRYKEFIGQTFTVDVGAAKPLEIKVIADEEVDPEFGTGALGVTPAHSQVDFAMYEKQKAKQDPIGIVQVIGQDGKMTEEAGQYAGLGVEEAREKFVAWLDQQGLIENEEEIMQNVGTSDRYGDVIEAIPMTQWWLDMNKKILSQDKSLRDLMSEALTTGLNGDASQKVVITPDRFTKLYMDRVDNLRDWCLSRQLWWGHRIPVWYRGEEIHVGLEEPEGEGSSSAKASEDKWEQDEDTLDTWFSSGSWTFSTLGWPDETEDLKKFHPTTWMQMGYEILYLWLMRMVLMSTYSLQEIPFKDVYIHGMLRDQNGQKFSKSAGNGIDPIEVIETYGADALRISLLLGVSPGNDSRYYTEKIESGRNFTNKLWNISRFVLTSVESDTLAGVIPTASTLADKWILGRFSEVIDEVTQKLDKYEFSQAGELLRDFTWNEFADWYLEIAKIQRKDQELVQNTDKILLYILENLLVLWHPFMPFVTEEIWKMFETDQFIMVHAWPKAQSKSDPKTTKQFELLQDVVTAIRNLRAEYRIEPGKQLPIHLVSKKDSQFLESQTEIIRALARVSPVQVTEEFDKPEGAVSAVTGSVQIYLPLAGIIDADKEKARLAKELEGAEQYLASLEKRLANKDFVQKAPEKMVSDLKQKKIEAEEKVNRINYQLENL